jgi:hypothetical protein
MVHAIRLLALMCAAWLLAPSLAHAGGGKPDGCAKCGGYPEACDPRDGRTCLKHRCHRGRRDEDDRSLSEQASDYFRSLTPPTGIVVSSVPVFSSPVLLSQDRYIVAPTALAQQASRALQPPAPGCDGSRDLSGGTCPTDRSLTAPGDMTEIRQRIEQLFKISNQHYDSIESLRKRVTDLENGQSASDASTALPRTQEDGQQ